MCNTRAEVPGLAAYGSEQLAAAGVRPEDFPGQLPLQGIKEEQEPAGEELDHRSEQGALPTLHAPTNQCHWRGFLLPGLPRSSFAKGDDIVHFIYHSITHHAPIEGARAFKEYRAISGACMS